MMPHWRERTWLSPQRVSAALRVALLCAECHGKPPLRQPPTGAGECAARSLRFITEFLRLGACCSTQRPLRNLKYDRPVVSEDLLAALRQRSEDIAERRLTHVPERYIQFEAQFRGTAVAGPQLPEGTSRLDGIDETIKVTENCLYVAHLAASCFFRGGGRSSLTSAMATLGITLTNKRNQRKNHAKLKIRTPISM